MADERSYNFTDEITTYDGDVYFNVDKPGFTRAKKYKASTLLTHFGGSIVAHTIELDTSDVAGLGVPLGLLETPGAGKTYQIFDIKWAVYPTTQLDVGTQDLHIYFEDLTLYLAKVRNDQVESATDLIKGVQIQAEHELKADKGIYCKLSGGTNPASGSATMTFWFIYKIIDV